MSNNTKNYMKQGGKEWVVNGKLTVGADGSLLLKDTVTGTVYNITIENGVITPVEV